MHLIDSHCHLDFEQFDLDRWQILKRCQQLGISHIVIPGVTAKQWSRMFELCDHNDMLHPGLGLHPMFMQQHQADDLKTLELYLSQKNVVAIGEIGLDFYSKDHDKDAQIKLVTAQLKLAQQADLPVILHVRKAHDQMIALLKQYPVKGGIVHAFSGSEQQARNYIKQGMLFGIGGAYSYKWATRLHNLIKQLPLSSIVLETDAPDMPLEGKQGQRNSPESIAVIANIVADLRQQSVKDIARITTENCKRIFNI
ncbi:MAG: TatD family hydrolase [Gammaproteobacteria bacterium]|nr:TatD family hydrolase [Gammaproteobacteria bacterium]